MFGSLPTEENTQLLVDLARNLRRKFDMEIDILSGGVYMHTSFG